MEQTNPQDRDGLGADSVADQTADDAPLSVEESAALIERDRKVVRQRLEFPGVLIFGMWGIVWVIGFGLVYLAQDGSPGPAVPASVAGVTTGLLMVVAIAVSIIAGVRTARGIRGPSNRTNAMYGWSYTLGFLALTAINSGMARQGVSDEVLSLLWTSSSLLVLGVLCLPGGAMFRSPIQYGAGIWLLVVASVSVYAGFPTNYLMVSLGGGGTFLALAVLAARRPALFYEGHW